MVAGYAEHYDEKTKTRMPIIGLCEPFWQVPTIEEAISHLKLSLDNQRNLGYMKTSGHAFLHEMMHLYEVSGQNNTLDESMEPSLSMSFSLRHRSLHKQY